MPYFKQTFAFRLGPRGWTETYYLQHENLGLARVVPATTIDASMQCRSTVCVLQSITTTAEDGSRASWVNEITSSTALLAGTVPGPDNVTTAAMCRLRSVEGISRSLWLRGLRDSTTAWTSNYVSDPRGGLRNDLDAYLLTLRDVMQYRIKTFIAADQAVPHAIGGVIQSTFNPSWSEIAFFGPGHGMVEGDQVKITRMPQNEYPGLSGIFEVVAFAADRITIPYTLRGGVGGITRGVPKALKVIPDYPRILTGQFVRFSTRDTGRPTGQPRGRGRVATRRQFTHVGTPSPPVEPA